MLCYLLAGLTEIVECESVNDSHSVYHRHGGLFDLGFCVRFGGNSSYGVERFLGYLFRNRIFRRLIVDLLSQIGTSRSNNPSHVRDLSHKYFIASFTRVFWSSKMALLGRPKYIVSDSFYVLLMDQDSESILIGDDGLNSSPRRLFVVKYVLGAAGENSRLIFKNELTGYDFEQQIVYPTQKAQLDHLQSALESFAYGSPKTRLSRVEIENSKGQQATVKLIISHELVSEIIEMYQFAW
jgi:hypothetical protein